jgi:hypothetical protein
MDADLMIGTGKVCGTVGRFNNVPTVRAYLGPLPATQKGIQFTTDVKPTSIQPSKPGSDVLRRQGAAGVTTEDNGRLACIAVTSIWKRY